MRFAAKHSVPEEQVFELLAVVDKLERMRPEESAEKLAAFGVTLEDVRGFIAAPGEAAGKLAGILADLAARGLAEYVEIDLTIVRGLAYYTGLVFEVFDRGKKERALAGGGRYDQLISLMSDGKVDLPALGFGMGDVVLGNFIDDHPAASARRAEWMARQQAADVFVVVAKEDRRPEALGLVQKLREAGLRVEFELGTAKVGKQFQLAEQLGARHAVLVGDEWPQVKLKKLSTREEQLINPAELPQRLARLWRRRRRAAP